MRSTLNAARRRSIPPRVAATHAPAARSVSLAFSSSAPRAPRKLPPDYPRTCAQTSVDDASVTIASAKVDPDNAQEPEKPKKRASRAGGSPSKPPPPPPPVRASVGPDVIWSGQTLDEARTLPPDDMLQDALAQLLVTLQPQIQYRAAYTGSSGSSLVEPTMTLYCPIEGGDHVIDDTVKELANRIQADVIAIDAAQLAAGEHGSFGKAASVLKFQHNPLHFTSSPSGGLRNMSEDPEEDEDEDDEDDEDNNVHPVVIGNVSAFVPVRAVRLRSSNPFAPASSPSRNTPTGQSELKAFFESIINAPVPGSPAVQPSGRPRIIYIRDFSLLAPSAQTWYPALLSAIRTRRQGVLLKPSQPVQNPTTLVLGVSPSIASQSPPSAPSPPQLSPAGIMNMLMNQRNGIRVRPGQSESHSPVDDRARRLRDRLKRWSSSGSILDDLPPFFAPGSSPSQRSGFMSANGFTSIFGAHPSTAGENPEVKVNEGASVGTGNKSGYFRVCGVVPAVRDEARERASRKARRVEVNALVVRMAIGVVGGRVVGPSTLKIAKTAKKDKEEVDPIERMTDDWSRRILDWPSARRLADRALACTVLNPSGDAGATDVGEMSPPPLQTPAGEEHGPSIPAPTAVTWDSIRTAWDALRFALGYSQPETKAEETPAPPPASLSTKWSGIGSPKEPVKWVDAALHQEPSSSGVGKAPVAAGTEGQSGVDDLVEKIKNDPQLETHEERLLGCIVNPAELQATFAQVHLPDTTIDSVRTLVSLPLLYPAAFRSGILSQHAMTGALLFGPPGTGKTLVAKALAKESGARMMLVKPSDVMDMYVGEGEKLVRSVFSLARRLSPCIVFLDEIDALLGARSSRDVGGAASAHRGLITEFMQEMDGLRSNTSSNVVVIGATNRPFDLDDAVLRRLPRRLLIDLPGLDEREAILKIMLSGESVADDVDVKGLAKRTEGFSGSDLKNLVVAAALDAVKENVELPWRKTAGKKPATVVDMPKEDAANIGPDATSSDQPVPDTTWSSASLEPAAESDTTEAPSFQPTNADALSKPTNPELSSAIASRTLAERHFAHALKEITPSASEALGTLADLRKWNAEFGQGDRKKNAKAWGGKFGFGGSGKKEDGEGAGRVSAPAEGA
ncbi:AAA family ATPase [Ceratobasidium sp. AG-Ba]|nr:AAA family ATPase [Ceratobasidium sp. AG-Ba]